MNDTAPRHPVRVGLVSLGCAKNLVDAEIMLGALAREGIEITNEPGLADVLIINTCSFIDAAQAESVNAILQAAAAREAGNRRQGLIVAGCLPQRFREDLPKLLPEVDVFMGIDQVPQAPQRVRDALARRAARLSAPVKTRAYPGKVDGLRRRAVPAGRRHPGRAATAGPGVAEAGSAPPTTDSAVNVSFRPSYIPDYATPRFRLTPAHFAYLKIAEGCNHPCSFCTIPRMRGSHRSRAEADVVAEARQLIASGVKEINLISQDTTYYGRDLRANHHRTSASPEKFCAAAHALSADTPTLCTLLRALNALPGEFWIRLLYTHPAHWTEDLIRTMAECPKVARYVDLPLQHIEPTMLERMRRETSPEHIVSLISRLRAGIPGLALRTTFIVGFPGETEERFEVLLDFIRETKFERLGVFTYSHEAGTRAAAMTHQIPERVKRRRRNQAMAEQQRVARQVSESFVGRTLKVLVEHAAGAAELRRADVRSWEHGLVRGADRQRGRLRGPCLVARGEADAPDIDGRVYVRGVLPTGHFASVRIIGHTDYDLIGEPA